MKDDLKRLLKEFLEEIQPNLVYKKDLQETNEMPQKFVYRKREPTLIDLIDWLNDDIETELPDDYYRNL